MVVKKKSSIKRAKGPFEAYSSWPFRTIEARLGANLLALGLASFAVGGTLAVIGFLEFSMWLNHVQVLNGDLPDRDLVLKNALFFWDWQAGFYRKSLKTSEKSDVPTVSASRGCESRKTTEKIEAPKVTSTRHPGK